MAGEPTAGGAGPTPVRTWRRFLSGPEAVAGTMLVVLTLIFLVSVFLRYVLGSPSAALNEWALLAMVPASTFALASADRRGGHISVDLLVRLIPGRARQVLERGVALVSAVACLYLAYAFGIEGMELRDAGVHTILARIGAWYENWLISLAFVLFGAQLVFRAFGFGDDPDVPHAVGPVEGLESSI